jgi:hypothetical protein
MLPELSKKYQYGFYRVGAEIITHKASALARAKQLGVNVTWHFHTEVYSKLNWEQDLPVSLDFIYQARARQLREKYEYLVLSFSGGSDSWTILKAFVDSGTHIDEVFVRWPVKATYKKYNIGINNNHENTVFEWELTILPMINKYKDLLPHTKFTIQDWSDSILTTELTDDDWLTVTDHLNPGAFFKINAIGDSELDAMIAGKNTAIIIGADKPQLWYDNGKVYCYFLDKLAHGRAGSRSGGRHLSSFERTSELFYWTPDIPELVLVQCREIFKYLQSNPAALQLIDRSMPYAAERKETWDKVVRNIIYNDYVKLNAFQAKKPTSAVHNENDAFMSDYKDLKFLQSCEYGLKNVFASVDEQYIQKLDGVADGFTGFIDGMYCLGAISPEVNR